MKLEHIALNVTDPVAMATWYVAHLGLTTVQRMAQAPYTHFLADSSGTMMLEIYNNPPDRVPEYAEMDFLLLHVAFVSEDPESDKVALLAAGATLVNELLLDDGTHVITLRDPWGFPIQLCKRAVPMLRDD